MTKVFAIGLVSLSQIIATTVWAQSEKVDSTSLFYSVGKYDYATRSIKRHFCKKEAADLESRAIQDLLFRTPDNFDVSDAPSWNRRNYFKYGEQRYLEVGITPESKASFKNSIPFKNKNGGYEVLIPRLEVWDLPEGEKPPISEFPNAKKIHGNSSPIVAIFVNGDLYLAVKKARSAGELKKAVEALTGLELVTEIIDDCPPRKEESKMPNKVRTIKYPGFKNAIETSEEESPQGGNQSQPGK